MVDALKRGKQVMVFVHSRKETGKTGRVLAEMAAKVGAGQGHRRPCRAKQARLNALLGHACRAPHELARHGKGSLLLGCGIWAGRAKREAMHGLTHHVPVPSRQHCGARHAQYKPLTHMHPHKHTQTNSPASALLPFPPPPQHGEEALFLGDDHPQYGMALKEVRK